MAATFAARLVRWQRAHGRLGLPWQHTRGSALLGWVKDDAEFIAQRIGAFARSHPSASASASPLLSGPLAR